MREEKSLRCGRGEAAIRCNFFLMRDRSRRAKKARRRKRGTSQARITCPPKPVLFHFPTCLGATSHEGRSNLGLRPTRWPDGPTILTATTSAPKPFTPLHFNPYSKVVGGVVDGTERRVDLSAVLMAENLATNLHPHPTTTCQPMINPPHARAVQGPKSANASKT